ncbi:alpha/beta hydrolase [Actinacidiphila guanduensis]|uniref:Alpha/beta hydrolase n=1 Tax=Actinacidiphila guanduensis TaxID=310781 RepID=A0A1H0D048_9ACTN|nr:alpha/beta hydrolase [Actinacidiphila guanduensis]SDN63416.1 Alpha/beta hydrolase [Actinacidiphila guanduensis]
MIPARRQLSRISVRTLLALAVAFVMLATTGWTGLRPHAADDARAAAVAAWMTGTVGVRHLPSPNAAPGAIARFFASLTASQRLGLAKRYPLVVGNLNGVAPALRYTANRFALIHQRTVALRRSHSSDLSYEGQQDAADLAQRYTSLLSGHRQILAFDPTGSGRVAEVLGDLSTARRVAVVVPGVDTDLLTFERDTKTYQAPAGMARELYAAERHDDPGAHTAVIAWADYTAPAGLGLDASTGTLAQRGAVRLNGLLSALPQRAQVALFCHSYGSVLCGVAAPGLPGRVSDLTVLGSPGMRANNVADLHTRAHVWAVRDSGDWIGDVPHLEFAGLGHGPDPVSRSFGARVISSTGASGHPNYFAPDTTSLANFAEIALGSYTAVACRNGLACTAGLP